MQAAKRKLFATLPEVRKNRMKNGLREMAGLWDSEEKPKAGFPSLPTSLLETASRFPHSPSPDN